MSAPANDPRMVVARAQASAIAGFRVCTTDTLRVLAAEAETLHLNRQIVVPDDIDPDGTHMLLMVLYGHNMDQASTLHHRCQVWMKMKDTGVPDTVLLDVTAAAWDGLQTVRLASED